MLGGLLCIDNIIDNIILCRFIYNGYVYIDIFIYLYLSIYKTGVRFIGHQAEPQQKTYII